MKRMYLIAAAAIVASALTVKAQDANQQRPRGGGANNPLFAALDTNKDGTLDADEIAGATASLKKLDKNGDGKLTREELRPAGAGARGEGGNRPEGERPRRRQAEGADKK